MDDLGGLKSADITSPLGLGGSTTTISPLVEVKCRKNLIDLRYVVNNVDNMHTGPNGQPGAGPPTELRWVLN